MRIDLAINSIWWSGECTGRLATAAAFHAGENAIYDQCTLLRPATANTHTKRVELGSSELLVVCTIGRGRNATRTCEHSRTAR